MAYLPSSPVLLVSFCEWKEEAGRQCARGHWGWDRWSHCRACPRKSIAQIIENIGNKAAEK